MTRIGVRELRQNASLYLAQVKAGKVIEVTERGELIAIMRSPSPEVASLDRLVASGRITPAAAPFELPLRRLPLRPDQSTAAVLDASRSERLR